MRGNVGGSGGGGSTDSISQVYFNDANTGLADSTTYYLGQMTGLGTGATSIAHPPLPAGTLTAIHIVTWTTNTVGTEGATFKLVHAGGTYTINDDIKFNARNAYVSFTGLSVAITAGVSYIQIETPVYGTNPANSQTRVLLVIQPS